MSDKRKPQTVSELMSEASQAFHSGEFSRLEELVTLVRDWMQPAEDLQAQLAMLEALMCGVEAVRDAA
jgi:hypothetical protein